MNLRRIFSPPAGMRVLALGSCRIHDPLMACHRLGQVQYLNRHLTPRAPVYLHDIHEIVQFVRLAKGQLSMPGELEPFVFFGRLRLGNRSTAVLEEAERVVIEVCTDKHYEATGHTLNINELHRQLVEKTGAAGQRWWLEIDRGNRPSEGLVQAVEAELRTARKLTAAHSRVLRELALSHLSSTEIAEGMSTLRALLDRPILVVPHVAVRLQDGTVLEGRIAHIEKTLEAARMIGMPALDPREFVGRDGQQRALDAGGTDIHHYAKDYMPIAGLEIIKALSSGAFSAYAPKAPALPRGDRIPGP